MNRVVRLRVRSQPPWSRARRSAATKSASSAHPSAAVSEASLSFLGFGLSPEIASWGTLRSRDGRKYMEQAPWLALWPGLCLTLTGYSLNMFGDAVRDLLDPRLTPAGRPSRRLQGFRIAVPHSRSSQSSERGLRRRFITAVTTMASPWT